MIKTKNLAHLPWASYARRTARGLRSFRRLPTDPMPTARCAICGKPIAVGSQYQDGGPGRRAHVGCLASEGYLR